VRIGGDSLIFGGGNRDSMSIKNKNEFPYALNSVKFEFAAPFFDQEEQTLYAFKLEGFDEKWSTWGRMTEKEYTNLYENSYTFLVKAKNIYGKESDVASYQISFSPPFYRRWWAFLIYILGTLAGIYALVRWNTKRLILEKTALENTIRERTAEILQQNENVKKLSEIGRELTASLNLQHILSTLYAHVNAIMDASVFGIGLYKADKQIIDYQMAIEKGVFYKPYTRDMTDKNQLPVWCIENREEIFINDIEIDESKYLRKSEVKTTKFVLEDGNLSELPQSIIYVPLLLKDQVLGIITVQSFQKNSYTEQHLVYLKNIASYASIALDNSISYLQIAAQQKEIAEANDNINQANEELQQQQEELLMMNENLENQKTTLALTYWQLKITSEQLEKSIEYASHIQAVIMPEKEQLLSFFSDIFILYQPKDVVSGDFYWFAQTAPQKAIFALADCTGHGVPGAFMTMLGATLMHEIVNVRQLSGSPSDILQHLHCSVQKILKQVEGQNNDGMDISVCFFEKESENNTRLIFAGAKSRMCYTLGGEIFEIHGDKQFLGGKEALKSDFSNQEFLLPQSTQFYLFSDGYADQNDEKRKKIGSNLFKKTIAQNSHLPFEKQKEELLRLLFLHQNTEAQRDDITVVALKM
jgi:serine phosphatase RsbU (regulator of sigma subunit)